MSVRIPIIWGSHVDESSTVREYSFANQAEANAFMIGIEASNGWMAYTLLEDGNIVPENEHGGVTFDEDGYLIANGRRVDREGFAP